jgi:hypothetical protein
MLVKPASRAETARGGDPAGLFNNTRPVYLRRFQASHHVFLLAAFELWLRQWSPSAP